MIRRSLAVVIAALAIMAGMAGVSEAAKPNAPAVISIDQAEVYPADLITFTIDFGSHEKERFLNVVSVCYDYGTPFPPDDVQVGFEPVVWATNDPPGESVLVYGGLSPWHLNGGGDSSCRTALYRYYWKGQQQYVTLLSNWTYYTVDDPRDPRFSY